MRQRALMVVPLFLLIAATLLLGPHWWHAEPVATKADIHATVVEEELGLELSVHIKRLIRSARNLVSTR